MQFDFETMLERHGMDSIAVDAIGTGFAPAGPKKGFDAIPMWVADMNYATCPAIQESVIRRVQHPAFGYFDPSDAYYDSIIRWQETRNRVTGLEKKHIGYENGVLGGVISTLNALCSKGWIIQLPAEDESRRKEYRLTEKGIQVLRGEVARLRELADNGEKVLAEE